MAESIDLKQLAAVTALNAMMAGARFNICAIDNIATMLAINAKGDAYDLLCTLHCIEWGKMPIELREAVPGLIKECLSVGPVFKFKNLEPEVIDVAPSKKRGLLRLLGVGT